MRNSLKKRLFAHLYSILVISCTFALVQKKNLFTVLVWFFVNFAKAFLSQLSERIQVVSPRKVSRFAPLNCYYIIIDEVFFDNFLVIIYLLVCKKIIILYSISILSHFMYFCIGTKKKQPFYCSCVVFCKFCKKSFARDL
jgi:hypothetical protein